MGDPSRAGSHRQFLVALGAAAGFCLVFAVLLGSSLPQNTRESVSAAGLVLGGVAAFVGCASAAARCQGRKRRSWAVLASAGALGLLTNGWSVVAGIDPVADPSPAVEGGLAVGMVLTIVGLLGLRTVRQRGPELGLLLLDGFVMGLAVLVMASIVVFAQLLDASDAGPVARFGPLLFPLLDVVLATVALLLITRSEGDAEFYSLVGVGFLLYAVADMAFAVQSAEGNFHFGTVQDLGWIGGYLLFAAMTWHPEASTPPREGKQGAAVRCPGHHPGLRHSLCRAGRAAGLPQGSGPDADPDGPLAAAGPRRRAEADAAGRGQPCASAGARAPGARTDRGPAPDGPAHGDRCSAPSATASTVSTWRAGSPS